jgi:CBS domain containing-hemolysin-like protein
MSTMILWWLLGFVGLAGSAMCSGLEVGLYSVNRVRLQVRARLSESASIIEILRRELEHPARMLTALLISNNVFNYLGTLAITALLSTQGFSDTTMILLQAVILTPIILIFGEAIPKELFRGHADTLMPRFTRVLLAGRLLLTALLVLPAILWIARHVARLVGVDPQSAVGSGRERMAELLKYGSAKLSNEQVSLIDRALEFESTRVRDQMVAIIPSETVPIGWTRERAAKSVAGRGIRWVPVLGSDHKIVGLISVLDLHRSGSESIEDLMQSPVRISGNKPVRRGLEELGRAGTPVGLVEIKGRDAGLVTIRDLVEPLMGAFAR